MNTCQCKAKRAIEYLQNSKVLLAFLMNVFFLLLVLVFCDMKYEVSDDFIMAEIMAGEFGESLNPHMIFVNVIWGYFLMPFYKLFPTVSWYFVMQIALIFLSSTAVTYYMLEKLDDHVAVMLSVMLIMFFSNDAYILVQFTKTAIFAIMAGSILFLDAIFYEKGKLRIILGAILCLAGTLIRFNDIYIAGGFLLFIIFYELINIIRTKEKKSAMFRKVIKIAASGAVLIIIAFGMHLIDGLVYQSDEDYAYFREYGTARAKIVDYTDYGYEAYQEELEAAGVSETEYNMMKRWNFADNEVFSLEKMQQTAEIIVSKQSSFWKGWNSLIESIQARSITAYPVFMACMLLLVLSVFLDYRNCWTVAGANLIGWLYIIYFFVRERTVYRTEFAVFLGIFLCGIYFLKQESGWNEKNIEFKKVCLIITGLLFVYQSIIYLPDFSYKNVTVESKKGYVESTFFNSADYDAKKYRKVINKTDVKSELYEEMQANPENYYFLNFGTTIQTFYYDWSPWKVADWGDNYQYFAGVTTNFPDINDKWNENGLSNPLEALVNDNVYLVDNYHIDLTVEYIREHYYPNARAELYKEAGGYQIWKICKE